MPRNAPLVLDDERFERTHVTALGEGNELTVGVVHIHGSRRIAAIEPLCKCRIV
jgi:hypothetical protein